MDLAAVRDYCLALPETTESLPFGEQALVFKVCGKMFALLALDELPPWVTLKCDPEQAVDLRERYTGIVPGYHMNKRHWNTVVLDGRVPSGLVRSMLDGSYRLVMAGLRKNDRERVRGLLEHRGRM